MKLVGELEGLAMRMVFESYGAEKERCDRLMESKDYLLRVIKYRKPEGDESDVGLQTHSDLTLLSVLHQLNLSGLEIKPKNKDQWIGVQASQSSYVVMAGDALKVTPINYLLVLVYIYIILISIYGYRCGVMGGYMRVNIE